VRIPAEIGDGDVDFGMAEEAVLLPGGESCGGAEPEGAVFVFGEGGDGVVGQFRRCGRAEDGEAVSVEADEAGVGADPEIAVGGGEDCRGMVRRHAGLHAMCDENEIVAVEGGVVGRRDGRFGSFRRQRQCRRCSKNQQRGRTKEAAQGVGSVETAHRTSAVLWEQSMEVIRHMPGGALAVSAASVAENRQKRRPRPDRPCPFRTR